LCFHRFIVNRIKAILYLVSADVKITHEFSIRHALSVSGKLFELCAALVNEILGYHSLLPLSLLQDANSRVQPKQALATFSPRVRDLRPTI
jgi:hypothetical protein